MVSARIVRQNSTIELVLRLKDMQLDSMTFFTDKFEFKYHNYCMGTMV